MPTDSANPLMQFLPMILIFGIFWFLLIKPQQDKEKKRKEKVNNMKKGDEIVTSGGIHGKVHLVKETTVFIKLDDNVKVEFDKEAISDVITK